MVPPLETGASVAFARKVPSAGRRRTGVMGGPRKRASFGSSIFDRRYFVVRPCIVDRKRRRNRPTKATTGDETRAGGDADATGNGRDGTEGQLLGGRRLKGEGWSVSHA